ncbi:MAG: CehA/McbA family metallohydrolase [Actinomycetota bacterium]|nr:CehA/McbA family metallohydrolase [Actinomycetota bacterium]
MSILRRGQAQGSGVPLHHVHDVAVAGHPRWLRLDVHDNDIPEFSLILLDPDQRVRAQYWGKSASEQVVVGLDPTRSSVGTVPGPLAAGSWRVEVFGAGSTRPGAYSVEVEYGSGKAPAGTLPPVGAHSWHATGAGAAPLALDPRHLTRRLRTERRWYRGDFHAHTRASDGQQSPAALTEQASARGLDFFSITEHNLLTTGWPTDDVLVVPGTEVTSSAGHFNAIGVQRWLEWRPNAADGGCETSEGMTRLLADTRAQGAVASINHPLLPPWAWRWTDTPLDAFDAIEIWNDPTYPRNEEATEATLRLWSRLSEDGHRITGIGGSDTHLLPHDSYVPGGPPSVVGDPWTAVLADELSVIGIVAAVRAGRTYMSRGPVLGARATVAGESFPPGASLTAALGRQPWGRASVRVQVDVANATPGTAVHWVGTGGEEAVALQPADGTGTAAVERLWDASGWQWLRAELRDADGALLAVINPFSAGQATLGLRTWGDLLASG